MVISKNSDPKKLRFLGPVMAGVRAKKEAFFMETWEVDIVCPLCGIKTRLNKIQRHRNRRHPEYSSKDYEALILEEFAKGNSLIDTKRAVKGHADAEATKALMKRKKYSKRITGVVSGGAVELGKKR